MRDILTRRLTYARGGINTDITFAKFLPTCRWISDLFKVSQQRIARHFNDSSSDDFVDTYTDSITTLRSKLAALPIATVITGNDATFLMSQVTIESCTIRFTKAQSSDTFDANVYQALLPSTIFTKPSLSQDDINSILVLINNIIHVLDASDQQIFQWYNELLNLLSSQLPLANTMLNYNSALEEDINFFFSHYNNAMIQNVYSSSKIASPTGVKMTNWMYDYIINPIAYRQWKVNNITGRNIISSLYHSSNELTLDLKNIRITVSSLQLYLIDPPIQYLLSMASIETENSSPFYHPLAPAALVSEYL